METMNSAGGVGGGVGIGYADSLDSSPRSRGGESWDEPFPSSAAAAAAAAAAKLRLMCSYGGRIVPRPTDKSLCYLGGETRIVVVDRHTTLADLSAKLSRSLLAGCPFTLKYQLPNEDLDSLISVTTDEDLDNMIDEYDRILASVAGGASGSRSSRLRLFLFPSKPESAPSSIGSLLDDSKSENWFVDALNGAIDGLPRGLSADSSSVNCLLGLEDDSSVHSRSEISVVGGGGGGGGQVEHEPLVLPRPDSSSKLARHGMEVQSVPDSPMVETASSFGSTSSAPYLSNLPPIRVRADDRPVEQRIGGMEDHFSQMSVSAAGAGAGQRLPDEGVFKDANFPVVYAPPPPSNITISTSSNPSTISPSEIPSNKFFSSDDNRSDHAGVHRPQQKATPVDSTPFSEPGARPMYYQERVPPAAAAMNPFPDPKREVPISSYVLPPAMSPAEQQFRQHQAHAHQLPQQQPPQQQQQQQQQFIPANPHYLHHAAGTVVPFPSYYQVPIQQTQQSHPFDQQQIPVYYLPVRQNPAPPPPYNMPPPTSISDTTLPGKPVAAPLPKVMPVTPELTPMYRTAAPAPANSGAIPSAMPPMIHVAAGDQGNPYAGLGYHVMHHHHSPQAPAAVPSGYNYEFTADPAGNPSVYYTQATSPPGLAPQYQTVVSSAAVVTDASPTLLQQSDGKHTRAT